MEILKGKFTSVSLYNGDVKIDEYVGSMVDFHKYVRLCGTKFMTILHAFLRTMLPSTRNDLLPGCHWVWDALRCKLQNILAIMIVSGHIVEYKYLLLRDDDECILAAHNKCVCLSDEITSGDLNGNYIMFDKNRNRYF